MTKKKEVKDMDHVANEYRTMYTAEHEEILDSIYEKETAINTMTKELKPLKKFIQGVIGNFGGLITGKYFVSFKKEEVTTFETAKFKADFPDAYEKYSKTTSRRKWLLNPK